MTEITELSIENINNLIVKAYDNKETWVIADDTTIDEDV